MKQIDLTNLNKSRKSPFKVPDGYFEDFASQLMTQIPDKAPLAEEKETPTSKLLEPKVTLFERVKPYLYLAAMISGLAFGVKVYQTHQNHLVHQEEVTATISNEQASEFVDEVCDFAMISDYDVYACATETY